MQQITSLSIWQIDGTFYIHAPGGNVPYIPIHPETVSAIRDAIVKIGTAG